MLSPFVVNGQPLQLSRFPLATQQRDNNPLQAWDATDEYLLSELNERQWLQPDSKILIFNDSFGALSLNFPNNEVYSVSDSFVSQQGLQHNRERNALQHTPLTLLDSLAPLPAAPDIILYKIPKSNALLIEQLIRISRIIDANNHFVAGAKAKEIHGSTLKLFEKYLGSTHTSLARKKARLVFCQSDKPATQQSPYPTEWPLEHSNFVIANHANVFAREKLDLGARFFRQHLPDIAPGQQVIDLGCGNGVIGLSVLAAQSGALLHFVDESYMATASAKLNVQRNLPQCFEQCQFSSNDCLTGFPAASADVILCNPPFHQQQAVTDHIAWQMFNDSYRVLKKGGELRIIGNRQLGYHVKLKRLFGGCQLIASNAKFVILSVKK